LKNLKHFVVDVHPQFMDTRCLFAVKEDGAREDFSVVKCIDNLERKYEVKWYLYSLFSINKACLIRNIRWDSLFAEDYHWLYFLMNYMYSLKEILPLWSTSILSKFHLTISSVIWIFKGLKVSCINLLNS